MIIFPLYSFTLLTVLGPPLPNVPVPLSSLSAMALKVHPRLLASASDQDAAAARRSSSLAPFRPQLSLNGYATFGNGAPIFPGTVEPVNYAGHAPGGFVDANATFMWRLFSFGHDAALSKAGNADIAAAGLMLVVERQDVLLGVRLAFADAKYQRERSLALRDALQSAQELERITQARYAAGTVPAVFTVRAKADTSSAERDLAMAQADDSGSQASLWDAAGLSGPLAGGPGDWDIPLTAPSTLDQAVQGGLRDRPEYKALLSERTAAEARRVAARKSGLPELSLMAMHDWMGGDRTSTSDGFKAGLVLSFPLGDGGARRAEGALAAATITKQTAALAAMKNRIVAEVSAAWAQWSAADSITRSAVSGLAASQEAYRVSLLRYQDGKAILAELTDARAQLTLARLAVAEAAEYREKAWSRLTRAMGS